MYTLIFMSSRKNLVRQHTISRGHVFFSFLPSFSYASGGSVGSIMDSPKSSKEPVLKRNYW